MEGEREEEEWVVPSSQEAKRSINMIRQAVERTFLGALDDRDESKDLVSLSIGDPAIFGNLPPHQEGMHAGKTSIAIYNIAGNFRGTHFLDWAPKLNFRVFQFRDSIEHLALDVVHKFSWVLNFLPKTGPRK